MGFPLTSAIFDLQKLNKLRELKSKGSEIIMPNYFETKGLHYFKLLFFLISSESELLSYRPSPFETKMEQGPQVVVK